MQKYLSATAALLLSALLLAAPSRAQAPDLADAASFLMEEAGSLGMSPADLQDLVLLDSYRSRHTGVAHLYVQQRHDGIPVHNAVASVSFRPDGRPLGAPNRFVANLAGAIESSVRALGAEDAALAAATSLGLDPDESFYVVEARHDADHDVLLNSAGIALEPIRARLAYERLDSGSLRLAWIVGIYEHGGDHYWNVSVDAQTGRILRQVDLVVHDHWDLVEDDAHVDAAAQPVILGAPQSPGTASIVDALPGALPDASGASAPTPTQASGLYRVYPLPKESPSHAGDPLEDMRTVVLSGPDPDASPLGWHNDGASTYTVTRGNNVHAYTDTNASNTPDPEGEADGGPGLVFDFAVDFDEHPAAYRDAAVTNLFYWNNIVHDVLYHYGFDEPAGNFQEDNFGKGGLGNDPVRAEAQDGGGLNNANFFTPPDGSRPRMQMYVWSARPTLVVDSPPDIAGDYTSGGATFGPSLDQTGVSGTVAEAVDDAGLTTACVPITNNAAAIDGKIALIDRGNCTFVSKVIHAQNAGAVAVIMVNHEAGVITMGGTDTGVAIPSLMVSLGDGTAIRNRIPQGVTATMSLAHAARDSDFDAGVIVHEYAHGISHRLTGGPSTTTCLSNAEQAGEGWSDWYGLMFTRGDVDDRGIGTYLRFEPPTGAGIRPARYSTSMALNPYTYGNIGSLSVPHGVGFVFASMLWEMTQALISQYGYDPNLHTGTGGNNLAMQLVTDGLKLQPCSPGFVDSRDAILLADVALTGGENQCLIWEAFAKRGLGLSADQGSPFSTTDGTEAFDVPTDCQNIGTDDGAGQDVLALDPPYPNPSAGAVNVRFTMPVSGTVTVEVIDMLGRRVALLVDDALPAGVHEITWRGAGIGSGSYVVRLRMGTIQLTRRVTVIR